MLFFAEMLRNCGNTVRKRAPEKHIIAFTWQVAHMPAWSFFEQTGLLYCAGNLHDNAFAKKKIINEGRGLSALIGHKQIDIVRKQHIQTQKVRYLYHK